jgi:Spy/CpxP family protein refolding chaperone
MTKSIGFSVLSLLISGAMPALAQERHAEFEKMPGLHELVRNANLTTAQKSQLREIRQATRAQNEALWTQMRSLREQIADTVESSGTVNAADVASLQQQLAQVRSQLDQQALKTAVQIRGLLTADQLSHVAQVHGQLKSLRAQMRALTPAPVEKETLEPGFGAP